MFSRQFKKKGVTHLSRYLKCYKRGDIVDIKVCLPLKLKGFAVIVGQINVFQGNKV
jgi:ribosomal protein L21E